MEIINISQPNDGLGDKVRIAFAKVNDNFGEQQSVLAGILNNMNQAIGDRGVANGIATLDGNAKVPSNQLPSYVDDVLEFSTLANFPATGEQGKIYIALNDNKCYRWSGSTYVYITSGSVDSVAGKTGIVTLNKNDVQLGSVDNTADSSKSVLYSVTSGRADGALKLWSTSHPTEYHITNNFDGTFWRLTANHAGGVRVLYSDYTGSVAWAAITGKPAMSEVTSVNGQLGAVTISPTSLGLGLVQNTVDSSKSVAYAVNSGRADGALKLWATSHPSEYHITNNFDGTFWHLTANHAGGVRVLYSDYTGSVAWAAITGKPALSQVTSVNGQIGAVVLNKTDFGLDLVNNTSDASKSVGFAATANYANSAGSIPWGSVTDKPLLSQVTSVNGQVGAVIINKTDFGLDQVNNTSDASKSVGYAASAGITPAVNINYSNDSNSNYSLLWGSGNNVYATNGIFCNPAYDSITSAAFYTTSDIRFKNVITKEYENVDQISRITYNWKDETKGDLLQIGYSAQDVQKHIPDAVSADENGYLSVNYIQVLVTKVEALEKRIKQLENGI